MEEDKLKIKPYITTIRRGGLNENVQNVYQKPKRSMVQFLQRISIWVCFFINYSILILQESIHKKGKIRKNNKNCNGKMTIYRGGKHKFWFALVSYFFSMNTVKIHNISQKFEINEFSKNSQKFTVLAKICNISQEFKKFTEVHRNTNLKKFKFVLSPLQFIFIYYV